MSYWLWFLLAIYSLVFIAKLIQINKKAKEDKFLNYLGLFLSFTAVIVFTFYFNRFGIDPRNENLSDWVSVATYFNNAFSPFLLLATIALLYKTWKTSEKELSMIRALTLSNEILSRLDNICVKLKKHLETEKLKPTNSNFHILQQNLKEKFEKCAKSLKGGTESERARLLKLLNLPQVNLLESIEMYDVNTQGKNKGFSYNNINNLNDLNSAVRNEMSKEAMFHTSRNRYFFIVLETLVEDCEQLQSLDKLNNENTGYLLSGYRAIRLALGDQLLMFLYHYYKESIDNGTDGGNNLLKESQGNIEKHLKKLTENLETSRR